MASSRAKGLIEAGTTDNDSNSTFLLREHYLFINYVVLDFVIGRSPLTDPPHCDKQCWKLYWCSDIPEDASFLREKAAVLTATVRDIVCALWL